ncbi:iron-containing redox enzyme family protein [Cellulomonas sp. H30R-01]|uniref:iron-containing redox enzyme family protein n=1 Tax=Cellulomonas sp. H30R-01 TaxID=2704467 RepID=UPI00138D5427|nr:iron-containing redox enzyme family protein [Cellulomonas sp. H30R-01]QHT55904.1 iron-containing redox enzyme family protein [Cellulomonas sp. H30R-01]
MKSPQPRGPLGAAVLDALTAAAPRTDAPADDRLVQAARRAVERSTDLLTDEDVQLTLFVLYELHYAGVEGVDEAWEWAPDLLRARAVLEEAFERELRARVTVPDGVPADRRAVADTLFALTAPTPGPSLSRYVGRHATDEQLHELLVHRSLYQLKEADPHTWAVPRLAGGAKAALVEIQADEYGGGAPDRMHSALFARTMQGVGLEPTFGRYVEDVPAVTLAAVNAMSLLGLHRRLRGAVAGHLAAFEMTSSLPNRLYGDGFRRHGYGDDVTEYFDEHVEADAVHEQIACRDLAGGLAEQEPELVADILFGACVCLFLDDLVAAHLVGAWERGESSLRVAA